MEHRKGSSFDRMAAYFVDLGRRNLDRFITAAQTSTIPTDFVLAEMNVVGNLGSGEMSNKSIAILVGPNDFNPPEVTYALAWARAIASTKHLTEVRQAHQQLSGYGGTMGPDLQTQLAVLEETMPFAEELAIGYCGLAVHLDNLSAQLPIEGKGWRLKIREFVNPPQGISVPRRQEIKDQLEQYFSQPENIDRISELAGIKTYNQAQ